MKATELLKTNRPPRILIYGAGGTGKTGLVSQASRGYLMDFDEGMRTACTLKDDFFTLRNEIEFDEFKENNPMKPTQWISAKSKLIDIMNQCAAGKWEYDCLVIDSFTGLCEAIQFQIMANCGKPMGKPEIREWGLIVAEAENAMALIKSLPVLTLVTAHELPIQLEGGSHIMKILAPGTKLPAKIPGWFDEVYYTRAKQGSQNSQKFVVSGRKTSSVEARTRSGMNKEFDHTTVGLSSLLNEIGFKY